MLSVGAVSSNLNIVSKSADYTAAANDFVMVNATAGPVTITMPASPGKNTLVAVKKADTSTNMVAIVPGAGALLNGDTAAGLVAGGASVTFQFDGVDWQMVSTGAVNAANTAAGIPTGGTSGQLLTKNSASNYDAGWTTPVVPVSSGSAAFPAWTSGRVMTKPMSHVYSNQSGFQPGLITAWPMRIPNACTVSSVSVYIATATTGPVSAYLSLYADTNGQPGVRLATANPTIPISTSGAYSFAASYTFTAPTTIWVATTSVTTTVTTTALAATLILGNFIIGPASGLINSYTMLQVSSASHPADLTNTAMTAAIGAEPVFMFQIA